MIDFIKDSSGWKRRLLLLLFGALVAVALPPLYITPLAFVGFCGFFIILNNSVNYKTAFSAGWWFGVGYFTAGLYWISVALFVDISSFWWLYPFALFGIPLVLAVYIGLVGICTFSLSKYFSGWRLIIIFTNIWVISELLRGYLFTGFPWNLTGYVWAFSDNILQIASITGIWGLSFLGVLVFTIPVLWLEKGRNIKSLYIPCLAVLFTLLVIFVWGGWRLSSASAENVQGVKLRIIQGNIEQDLKWDEEKRYPILAKYMKMSVQEGYDEITHIIWPETAIPFVTFLGSDLYKLIGGIVPKKGALITGALRAEIDSRGTIDKLWNSMEVINHKGELYSYYDKTHLVPFGEYVPFAYILPLNKIAYAPVNFAIGKGLATNKAPGFPDFSGLICYEVIFPGQVVDKQNRPGVIVNVTNDAWYGNTSGPYQHLVMARVRAVEEGIPLIRSANNGISAVIDPYGRVIAKTKLSTEAVLDSYLPMYIKEPTTYNRYSNAVIILLILICSILCTISLKINVTK